VDLTGKTVMPRSSISTVIRIQNVAAGTMSKTLHARNLIDHMQRLAYYGVGQPSASPIWWIVRTFTEPHELGRSPLQMQGPQSFPALRLSRRQHGNILADRGPREIPARFPFPNPVTTVADTRAAVGWYVLIKSANSSSWVFYSLGLFGHVRRLTLAC